MERRVFQQVASLGPNSRAKANIQRVFGRTTSSRLVFDWQITPTATLIEYFLKDFAGFFNLGDMYVNEQGIVCNRRFGTMHPYEFAPDTTEASFLARYPQARRQHEQRCEATRRVLENAHSTLFVLGKPLGKDELQSLRTVVAQQCAFKDHLVLNGPLGDLPDGHYDWEGDPELWSQHLAPFGIQRPLSAQLSYMNYRARKTLARLIGT